jgi:hypothetical protein
MTFFICVVEIQYKQRVFQDKIRKKFLLKQVICRKD